MANTKEYSGISFPFRVENGRVTLSHATYDDIQKIKESVYQILTIEVGERVNEPEVGSYGLKLVFKSIGDLEELLDTIKTQIELNDIRVSNVSVKIETFDEGAAALANLSL